MEFASHSRVSSLAHHFQREMIYRTDGHKQHNSLTNTQRQPRCRWHTYHYKSSEVASWKDGRESEGERDMQRKGERWVMMNGEERRVTRCFSKYIYAFIWMEYSVEQWHGASLLLAEEFKRWNGLVRHTYMMTRDGEDEYFWTIFTTTPQNSK